jgi:hypothetical protein
MSIFLARVNSCLYQELPLALRVCCCHDTKPRMAAGRFTLADRLGAKSMPCRVPGCTRTWIQLSSKALAFGQGASDGDPATSGMCEPCREQSRRLRDVERTCDRPGCSNPWVWTAAEQLEAFAAERPAPKRLCESCQALLDSLQDKEIPCAVPGCTRTAILTKQEQLLAQGQPEAPPEPPKPGAITLTGLLCDPCEQVSRRIRDREVNCGISGCKRKWIWKADEQIVAFAAGKPNEPPRRMCDACRAVFGKLLDREVRCRTSGCKNTWTWSRYDQLDACQADKPPPKAPSHMCKRCFDIWSTLKDVERPCRRSGCKGTWMDKRGAQLARAVRGKTGDPYPRLCPNCEKELGDLEDREIPCRTENCPGTFTWTREQQLAAGVRPKLKEEVEAGGAAHPETPADAAAGPEPSVSPEVQPAEAPAAEVAPAAAAEAPAAEVAPAAAAEAPATEAAATAAPSAPAAAAEGQATAARNKKNKKKRRREIQPPERRCAACAEFLANRKTQEIPCSQCGTPIFWPPESQLQTHLGNWAAPALCGACKLVQVQAAREAAREQLRHSHPLPGSGENTALVEPASSERPAEG